LKWAEEIIANLQKKVLKGWLCQGNPQHIFADTFDSSKRW
jgi:hypothetical protein